MRALVMLSRRALPTGARRWSRTCHAAPRQLAFLLNKEDLHKDDMKKTSNMDSSTPLQYLRSPRSPERMRAGLSLQSAEDRVVPRAAAYP